MTDTLFRDTSYYNPISIGQIVQKGYRVVQIRSNDGTFQDPAFHQRLADAKHACDTGKLDCFGVYFVFEDNWQQTLATFKATVGKPHAKMFIVIDVESWKGKIHGDHSAVLRAIRWDLVGWLRSYRGKLGALVDKVLGRQRKRVLGYANAGDFDALWPRRGSIRVNIANYSFNPKFPNQLAHQFAADYTADGLPAGDINSADGLSPRDFAAAVGCVQLSAKERLALFRRHKKGGKK